MVSTIVVPLDRSESAESALPFAEMLARQSGASLDLICVIDLPYEFEAWLNADEIIDQRLDVEDAYEDYLTSVAESIDGIPVNCVLRAGSAANEIQKYVEMLDDPLVVMSRHGRSGFRRAVTGSVTQQVVHRLLTPVIVVPTTGPAERLAVPEQIARVLVPLDGSPFAESALDQGLRVLGDIRPLVHLLQVVPYLNGYERGYSQFAGYEDTMTGAAQDYLLRIRLRLEDEGYRVFHEVRVGDVAEQIDYAAQVGNADLVVMATHGRSRVQRLIFGSIAERALRETTIPLMLVRPPDDLD